MLQNPVLWTFWCWCLLRANHSDTTAIIGFQKISLRAGQFIFGRSAASKELKMSVQKIRTCLESLKKLENLTIKSTNKFSIITIAKWNTYQSKETRSNHQVNQQLTNNSPATNQQLTTDKNVKNVRMKRKTTPQPPLGGNGAAIALPDWLDCEVWGEFKAHRTAIKAKMTVQAENLILAKLSEFNRNGEDTSEILKQSIERGWRGIFEIKASKKEENYFDDLPT